MEDQNLTTPSPIPGAETEPNPLLRPTNPLVSNTEQEVLDEYARLLENVNKVSHQPIQSNPLYPSQASTITIAASGKN